MNKTVLMFMGRSGSGKSTLERDLITTYPDLFHKVVSVTTRPPREGEQHGRDYYFVSDKEFDRLEQTYELIQKTEFANNRYGSTVEQYTTDHPYAILVVVPKVAKQFAPILQRRFPGVDVLTVHFNISDQRLYQNMKARGDNEEQIQQRLAQDTLGQDIIDAEIRPDYVINDDMLDFNLYHRFRSLLEARERRLLWKTS